MEEGIGWRPTKEGERLGGGASAGEGEDGVFRRHDCEEEEINQVCELGVARNT